MIMTLIEKVVPVVFRKINNNLEILVFRHPLAGVQIVKGTVEHQEQLEHAALRELYEESGIKSAQIHSYLGKHIPSEAGPDWHVFVCTTHDALHDTWSHFCEDDNGLTFDFFWHSFLSPPTEEWHPLFKELFEFIKSKYKLN
jgi:8-oxo-dGTP pyrophosphatase MutT (NUDIX family)